MSDHIGREVKGGASSSGCRIIADEVLCCKRWWRGKRISHSSDSCSGLLPEQQGSGSHKTSVSDSSNIQRWSWRAFLEAAIASYLPERTDNDIKNYWNTHLKKKLSRVEAGSDRSLHRSNSKGQWERCVQTDIHMARRALREALSMDNSTGADVSESKQTASSSSIDGTPTYALSAENISRLLEGWKGRISPKSSGVTDARTSESTTSSSASNCVASSPELRFGGGCSTAPLLLLDEVDGHGGQETLLGLGVDDAYEFL